MIKTTKLNRSDYKLDVRLSRSPRGKSQRADDGKNNFGLARPILASRYCMPTFRQPKPYFTLRRKLIEDASLKYLVGQLTSPIVKPCHKICASIWLSKTKSSEFRDRSIFSRTSRENAR